MRRSFFAAALVAAILGAGPANAAAPLAGPDRPAATPARAAGTAALPLRAERICGRIRGRLGPGDGLFVLDADSGRMLCRRAPGIRRPLASNMKLFTTATALALFGPQERISTRVFATGALGKDGVLEGSLYLKGGGDPVLGAPAFYDRFLGGLGTNLYGLRAQLHAAGLRKVTGRMFADDTVFDRLRGVADSGYGTSPYIGPLSGLAFNAGFSSSRGRSFASDPARLAARKLARSLRNRGVNVRTRTALRETPGDAELLAAVESPTILALANATNIPSNNFFAEMLIKNIGAHFGAGGSTRAGAAVVERFARRQGSGLEVVDGSGLTRGNAASPREVVRFLARMRGEAVGDDFVDSLAVAGREGTVADRMRGTPAEGRCRTKTGTISGVSNLSGYCFNRSGRVMAFSILMSGVGDTYGAHVTQDRIAALIAGY